MESKDKRLFHLVYREYVLSRSAIKKNLIMVLLFSSVCLMVNASAEAGNLAKMDKYMIDVIVPSARYMGMYISFLMFMTTADSASADIKNGTWLLFRKSSPASPVMLSLAKTIYSIIIFLFSFGCALVFLAINSRIGSTPASSGDIAMLSAIAAFIVFFAMSVEICTEFTRSSDKGGLLTAGVLAAVFMAFYLPNKDKMEKGAAFDHILSLIDGKVPFIWIAILLIFAAATAINALLYKRRIK